MSAFVNFEARVEAAQAAHDSRLVLEIAPWPEKIPYPLQRYDDAFLPFSKAIIEATANQVCGYVFNLGAFLCLGASGAIALERAMAYVPSPLFKILHGPFASVDFARAASESAFNADAVTLVYSHPEIDLNIVNTLITPYLPDPQRGVFMRAFDEALSEALEESAFVLKPQVGFYIPMPASDCTFLDIGSCEPMQWWGGDAIYTSRGDDFREAMQAALRVRRENS